MYVDFEPSPTRGPCWTDLPGDEALLLWSLRRMVVAWPRSHAVHVALHRRYGDDAPGVEHLMRCLLTGIARHATRPVQLGDPACALVLPDEGALLFALRSSHDVRRTAAALEGLCGRASAGALIPLVVALAGFIGA